MVNVRSKNQSQNSLSTKSTTDSAPVMDLESPPPVMDSVNEAIPPPGVDATTDATESIPPPVIYVDEGSEDDIIQAVLSISKTTAAEEAMARNESPIMFR